MKKEVGLWIDRRRAAIVTVTKEEIKMRYIISDIDNHFQFAGGTPEFTNEDIMDRRLENNLKKYYDKVISDIKDANSILIFGPGEAKIELKNRMGRKSFTGKKVQVETEDKMTDRQITAKVRHYFLNNKKV
jgi:nucleoid DNA-binding protein